MCSTVQNGLEEESPITVGSYLVEHDDLKSEGRTQPLALFKRPSESWQCFSEPECTIPGP